MLRAPIPIFPSASLPIELRRYASKSSLPLSALASAGLSALAVAIGGESEVWVTAETAARAIVWNVPIGFTSAGKSPAGLKLFGPLRDLDQEASDEYADKMKEWQAEDKHTHGPPVERSLVHGSLTIEALFDVLEDTPCMLQAFDELTEFLNDLGRYSKGPGGAVGADSGDAATYLKMWTGAPTRARRVGQRVRGRASVKLYCAKPTVSLWGPLTLANQGLLGGEGSGFRCRWLPYYVEARTDLPTGKIFDPGDVGYAEYTEAWEALIKRLHGRRGRHRSWYFTEAAKARVEWHRARWSRRAKSVESSTTVTAALGKADVAMASIALILAEAACQTLPSPTGRIGIEPLLRVDVKIVDRAAAWVDYCIDVWAFLGDASIVSYTIADRLADPVVTRVEEWIAQHGKLNDLQNPWVWAADLWFHKVAGVRARKDWTPTLERYADRNPGHVVPIEQGKPGPKPLRVYAPMIARRAPGNEWDGYPHDWFGIPESGSEFGNSEPNQPNSEPLVNNSDPPSKPPSQSQNGVVKDGKVRF